MPFIEVKTAKKLKSDVKLAIKAGIGASISDVLEQKAGIAKDDVYLCFLEFDNWGSRGVLK